ncbi:MAG: RluA family pseudouridine synthase, partial [Candidatus Chisholmbacteria bacterium]|nr:RluA family pseudouridine synthase [Candidatus Chisholmbacteria bacterium]
AKRKTTSQNSKLLEEFLNRSGIVHRLDKDTSGLLVVAKNPEAFENLQQQFKKREVQKTYLALVYGQLKPKEGMIAVPVGRSSNPKKFSVRVGGKLAQTTYQVEKYLKDDQGNDYTQVKLKPQTGRTHQLRVHLSYLGNPIVADSRYAGEKRAAGDRWWCPRQFLHAWRLELVHPVGGEKLKFKADLPVELTRALARLT